MSLCRSISDNFVLSETLWNWLVYALLFSKVKDERKKGRVGRMETLFNKFIGRHVLVIQTLTSPVIRHDDVRRERDMEIALLARPGSLLDRCRIMIYA